jgi:hypothetical protein
LLKRKTLFVVGAGASEEFGLPLGYGLASQISQNLRFRFRDNQPSEGDPALYGALQTIANNNQNRMHELFKCCRRISDGLPLAKSIDSFINTHAHDADIALIAKFSIAQQISRAEGRSSLGSAILNKNFKEAVHGFANMSPTWLTKFCEHMFAGHSHAQVESVFQGCSFICFNYDRVIQEFLRRSLMGYFLIDEQHAANIVANIKILHPYGNIGTVYPSSTQTGSVFHFGNSLQGHQIPERASKLRTFHEGMEDETIKQHIADLVSDAEVIVFLGFGYIRQNMQILAPQSVCKASKQIFGTAYKLSDSNTDDIRTDVERLFLPVGTFVTTSAMRSDLKCHALLSEYERKLFG